MVENNNDIVQIKEQIKMLKLEILEKEDKINELMLIIKGNNNELEDEEI